MGTTVFPKPLDQDVSGKQDKNDNSLETTSKTVVGAINEVNGNLSYLRTNDGYSKAVSSSTLAIKTNGLYWVEGGTDTPESYGYLLVMHYSSSGFDSYKQMFMPSGTDDVYTRAINAGVAGNWSKLALNGNVTKLESCVEHAVINANGGTKSVFVGVHGVVLLVGFLGTSGGIAALVHKASGSIYRAIDMFTGEAWSSSNLSFSASGDNVVITNNASQVSYFSILAAGSSR